MRSKGRSRVTLSAVVGALVTMTAGGCSSMPSMRSGGTMLQQSGGLPPVQDCGIVGIGSPSRYACPDGKVYTAFQLAGLQPVKKKGR